MGNKLVWGYEKDREKLGNDLGERWWVYFELVVMVDRGDREYLWYGIG